MLEARDLACLRGERAVFAGVSFRAAPGAALLLTGANGAGKSSLLRLVLRFSDPREGQVLLDGTDVRELGWDALRGAIGYVSQDVFLFHGTVRDNLAYGRVDATDEQVREAARQAATVLPGVRVRRLLFWRYLLIWQKPVIPGS